MMDNYRDECWYSSESFGNILRHLDVLPICLKSKTSSSCGMNLCVIYECVAVKQIQVDVIAYACHYQRLIQILCTWTVFKFFLPACTLTLLVLSIYCNKYEILHMILRFLYSSMISRCRVSHGLSYAQLLVAYSVSVPGNCIVCWWYDDAYNKYRDLHKITKAATATTTTTPAITISTKSIMEMWW